MNADHNSYPIPDNESYQKLRSRITQIGQKNEDMIWIHVHLICLVWELGLTFTTEQDMNH